MRWEAAAEPPQAVSGLGEAIPTEDEAPAAPIEGGLPDFSAWDEVQSRQAEAQQPEEPRLAPLIEEPDPFDEKATGEIEDAEKPPAEQEAVGPGETALLDKQAGATPEGAKESDSEKPPDDNQLDEFLNGLQ